MPVPACGSGRARDEASSEAEPARGGREPSSEAEFARGRSWTLERGGARLREVWTLERGGRFEDFPEEFGGFLASVPPVSCLWSHPLPLLVLSYVTILRHSVM
jgi:hypothetical protein